MQTWPAGLPQSPLIEGFSDTPQDSVLRSPMDGLVKQRNRFTAVVHDVTEMYLMTPVQLNTFEAFYAGTLGNGASEFLKVNPKTSLNGIYKFVGVYKAVFNGVQYKVTLPLTRRS